MRLRVGLIGLGDVWQTRHAPALRAMADRFEVRAICDPVRHRAEQAASEFHAEAVDGYHVLVQREDVDAVLVLAPNWFRALPILAACDSRKAIYCAVGLDLEACEAESIKRRVEEAGIAFMAEFPKRQAPATIRLKELIATQLGAPRLLFCHRRAADDSPSGAAAAGATTPPPTFRHIIGQVDWCHYVVDSDPTYVTGLVHLAGEEGAEDYRMLSVDFSARGKPGTGPIAQISSGRYIPSPWREAISYHPLAELQVSCVRGIAFVDLPATLVWFDEAGRHQESLESERPIGERLLTQFYRSVTSLVRRTRDLEDACLALHVVQAGRQSHEEGRRVEL
jgi:predicted dehydrogenase